MESTYRKVISACSTLIVLGRKQIPTPTAYRLYKLRQKLKSLTEFITERENAMADEMDVKVNDGVFQFPDEETKAKFIKAHDEFLDAPCDVEVEEQVIKLADLPDKLEISMNEIESLDGFIRFE